MHANPEIGAGLIAGKLVLKGTIPVLLIRKVFNADPGSSILSQCGSGSGSGFRIGFRIPDRVPDSGSGSVSKISMTKNILKPLSAGKKSIYF
jgi:hypothetical protein